ncbi:MAG: hypothetical protein ACK5DE_03865 [Bacteroidota bacterium]|jgi:hypothetical protein
MINSVRNMVLSVLNKNNYGYISPSDFNLYAQNAQMEIYEEYFDAYNQVINAENARMAGTDYADRSKPIAEAMEGFLRTDYLSKVQGNIFSAPSLTTTGYLSYMLLDLKCYPITLKIGTNTSVISGRLVDSTATFTTDGILPGDIVTNITTGLISTVQSVLNNTTIILDSNIFLASGNSYGIFSASTKVQAEKVLNSKILLLNNSNLTPPTNEYPAYVLQGETIAFYPLTIANKGQVEATYFRFPKNPKWTYITLSNGEPVFDQSQLDYQDFELPTEDEYKLVTRILQYCGISIRESEVAQFGFAKQQQEQNP